MEEVRFQPQVYREVNAATLVRPVSINVPSSVLTQAMNQLPTNSRRRRRRNANNGFLTSPIPSTTQIFSQSTRPLTEEEMEPIRIVFLAYRTSALFASNESTEWVRIRGESKPKCSGTRLQKKLSCPNSISVDEYKFISSILTVLNAI